MPSTIPSEIDKERNRANISSASPVFDPKRHFKALKIQPPVPLAAAEDEFFGKAAIRSLKRLI